MKYWNYKNLDINKVGDLSQVAGLRRYEFKEGKAKGGFQKEQKVYSLLGKQKRKLERRSK